MTTFQLIGIQFGVTHCPLQNEAGFDWISQLAHE
jgi:hypothetical protein